MVLNHHLKAHLKPRKI